MYKTHNIFLSYCPLLTLANALRQSTEWGHPCPMDTVSSLKQTSMHNKKELLAL